MSDIPPTPPAGRRPEKVPPALRPGDTDDILEGRRLTRVSVWGLLFSMAVALFIFGYWVNEPNRMKNTTKLLDQHSLFRGKDYFALPVNDSTGAQNSKGIGCATCHGDNAEGGLANNLPRTFLNAVTNATQTVYAPNLTNVFSRYAAPGVLPPGFTSPLQYIKATIDQGRTNGNLGQGDDMPTWSQIDGGPLTDQQIGDIILYLESIQQKPGANIPPTCGQPDGCPKSPSP